MVPHASSTSLQDRITDYLKEDRPVDFSDPGPAVSPSCECMISRRIIRLGNNIPGSNQCSDRLFISTSAVDHWADLRVPADASPTLTLGVELSLIHI